MTTGKGKMVAWGSRLRAFRRFGATGSACLDEARVASEVGIVPDYVKELGRLVSW